MRFPEQGREGTEVHADAVRRVDEARDHQHDMRDAHEASKHTSGEPAAADDLSAASAQTDAREAWLAWVERGY